MARPIGDEELQLKRRARRRLIGAIVLVMAVVVVLPMVLDREPKPVSQDIDIRIPSPDSGAFTSKVVPLPDAKPAAQSPPGVNPETTPVPESKTAPTAAPATKPDAATPAKKAEKAAEPGKQIANAEAPERSAKPAAKAEAGHYVVQVIALADVQKAKQVQQKLSAAGIKSYTEVVKTARGEVTRVRAGPFTTQEAAEKAREQLKGVELDGKKLDGKVIPRK